MNIREMLEFHMHKSGRVLNDLRSLRRLLFEERQVTRSSRSQAVAVPAVEAVSRASGKTRAVGPRAED